MRRDVVWHLDATHLGRASRGEVQGQVLRDAARSDVLAASVGGPATSADASTILRAAIEANGQGPLVVATDNGPPYVAKDFDESSRLTGSCTCAICRTRRSTTRAWSARSAT